MNFQQAAFELAAGKSAQLPKRTLPEIVFSGRSNVGKSSLINRLVNRKALARVSASPGKTATINFFRLENCRFVDLPGYGYARVSKSEKARWAELVEGYFAQDRAALVVQLVDFRRDPSPEDWEMIRFLQQAGTPFILVCTKCDKLNKGETQAQLERYTQLFAEDGVRFVPFSATKGTGLETVRGLIASAVEAYPEP